MLAQPGKRAGGDPERYPTGVEAGFPDSNGRQCRPVRQPRVPAALVQRIGADIVAVSRDKAIEDRAQQDPADAGARRRQGIRRIDRASSAPHRHDRQTLNIQPTRCRPPQSPVPVQASVFAGTWRPNEAGRFQIGVRKVPPSPALTPRTEDPPRLGMPARQPAQTSYVIPARADVSSSNTVTTGGLPLNPSSCQRATTLRRRSFDSLVRLENVLICL